MLAKRVACPKFTIFRTPSGLVKEEEEGWEIDALFRTFRLLTKCNQKHEAEPDASQLVRPTRPAFLMTPLQWIGSFGSSERYRAALNTVPQVHILISTYPRIFSTPQMHPGPLLQERQGNSSTRSALNVLPQNWVPFAQFWAMADSLRSANGIHDRPGFHHDSMGTPSRPCHHTSATRDVGVGPLSLEHVGRDKVICISVYRQYPLLHVHQLDCLVDLH